MQFFATVAILSTAALATAGCTPGTYQCSADNLSIQVCDFSGNWVDGGACPDDTVCSYLPQNGFSLPFCTNPPTASKRAASPAERRNGGAACTPGQYYCAGTGGIQVCDTQGKLQYVGDCPKNSHCAVFPSGIPYCISN